MIVVLMRLLRRTFRHPPSLLRVALLLGAILAYGTTGFLYFEVGARPELAWSDALWWAVVTLTTVGYGDIAPVSTEARFVVGLPLMGFGIGLLGYVLSFAAAALVEAKTREVTGMGEVRLARHVMIVNYPNLGKIERILLELTHPTALGPDLEVVLVDEDLEQLPHELVRRNVHFVRGNPTRDETLSRAGVERASHAIVLSKRPGDAHSDDLTIAVALAIEARSAKVRTVVECVDPSMEELLRKTGCDSIVCTSRFDAHFVGAELTNPGAQEVVDHLLSAVADGQQLFITRLPKGGQTYASLARECVAKGHVAIGAKRRGALQLNPPPEIALEGGDEIVTIGPAPLAW